MNRYPFMIINSTGEDVTYSALENDITNIYVEKQGEESCSLEFELSRDDVKLIEAVGYADADVMRWKSHMLELKDVLLALAKDKADNDKNNA